LYQKYGVKEAIVMFITSCLMIPYPKVPERYYNLFHLNPPTWSLMWEYVANLVYAFVLVRIRDKWLWALVVIAAACLFYEAKRAGHLMNGWGLNDIMGGGARVFFSFLAGILVYRSNFIISNKLGFIGMALLTFAVLVSPFSKQWGWIADPLIVVLYLPLLVALGAGAQISNGLKNLCKFSGEISYPLYMVHYPFIWLFMSYLNKYKPSNSELAIVIPVTTILLIAFAYLILKFVDEPIRNYLRRKMNKELA
jgi:peptidoglycan/LPS O-acetylase OafA/YrhL